MAANGTGKLKVSTGPFGNDSLLQATVAQYDIEGGCWAPPYWVFGERRVQRDIDGFVQYESWIIEWKCNCVVQYDKFPTKGYKFHSSVQVDTLLKENVLRCCLAMFSSCTSSTATGCAASASAMIGGCSLLCRRRTTAGRCGWLISTQSEACPDISCRRTFLTCRWGLAPLRARQSARLVIGFGILLGDEERVFGRWLGRVEGLFLLQLVVLLV